MNIKLKKAICEWLLDNPNAWQRVNACHDAFRAYVYDGNGNFLIGGEEVSAFISAADKLFYSTEF